MGVQQVAANGNNAAAGNENVATIPIAGVIHATYENGEHELKLDNSYLRSSETNIDLNGAVSQHSSLSVRLAGKRSE